VSAVAIVLAWLGLALGLVVLVVALALLQRVLRPVREIDRYADHILEAGLAIAANLDGVDEAVRTRELATAVPALATGYLERLEGRR
jgi:ABC-type antimicrobial peptide transport system permease subunit